MGQPDCVRMVEAFLSPTKVAKEGVLAVWAAMSDRRDTRAGWLMQSATLRRCCGQPPVDKQALRYIVSGKLES